MVVDQPGGRRSSDLATGYGGSGSVLKCELAMTYTSYSTVQILILGIKIILILLKIIPDYGMRTI